MDEGLSARCVEIFTAISGLKNSKHHFDWSDARLLVEPLDALGVDSLTLLEFVMAVEDAYNVELDEEEVNCCKKLEDLVALVVTARAAGNGPVQV